MYVAKTKALISWAIANAKGRFSLDMAQNEPSSVLVISIYQGIDQLLLLGLAA